MIRGGVLISDAVSMQEVDTENDAADPQYTNVFKVADTASEADGTVTFAEAVQQINADSSGTGNYLIELADDITLKETGKYYNSSKALISANTTTILGNGHTITIDNFDLYVVGNGTKVILGQPGGSNSLTFTGGSNAPRIIYTANNSTLDIYGGVTFTNCTPKYDILSVGESTVNLHDDVCIKGQPSQNGSALVRIGTTETNNYNAFLNMYDHSCIDGSEGGKYYGVYVGGHLNMYNNSCIRNINGEGIFISEELAAATMNDSSTIENCSRGIYSNGSFTMKDSSKIANCTYTKTGNSLYGGAGVYVSSLSVFTMEGNSSITDCKAYNGGAVNIYEGKFIMNSGSITNNTADQNGGGVRIQYARPDHPAEVELNSGTIANNHAKYGGGLYASYGTITSIGGTICNNTADVYAADVYASAGSTLPAASGTTTDGHTITGWYQDSSPRYSPKNYSKAITNEDLVTSSYSLIASYQDRNIHTITIAEDSEGASPGYAYLKDETTGDETRITGTVPGEKVYLSYENGNTLDGWTAEPEITIHPATEAEDAWFEMPNDNVTIACKDHYVAPVIKTDLGSSVIYPNEETAFTLSITPNNEAYEYALGSLQFDQPEAIEELYYFDLTDDTDSDDGSWRKLDVDSTGKAVFAYHDEDIDHELYLDTDEDATECKFRVTFNKKGSYTLSATLRDTDDDEGNPVMSTMSPVSFTVGYALTLPDGVTLDNLKVNDAAPKYDEDGDLIAKEGDKLTFTKPADASEDLIYKLVDANGDETVLEPDEDGVYTVTLPTGHSTITTKTLPSPDPGEPDFPDTTDTGTAIGVGVTSGVLIGGAAYLVGTQVWMELNLPDGVIPTNRQQLAMMLWKAAEQPQPQSTALYADIDADNTDAQQAARWCVEQGLMKDYGADFKPGRYTFRPQVIKAWYDLQHTLKAE